MSSISRSTESGLLIRLLRLAPYATTALSAHHLGALLGLRRRGLVVMDCWGVVSLTCRGELVAMAFL